MWILVPLGKIIVALPEPRIKSIGPDIVLTLDLPKDMLEKYFLSLRIVCVVAQYARHAFTLDVDDVPRYGKYSCIFKYK